MSSTNSKPRARVAGLVTRELESGETIVYDRDRDRVHCLNPSAAFVWRHSDGTRTIQHLTRLLHEGTGLPEDESLVRLALTDLGEAKLLECGANEDAPVSSMTRREAVRKLGHRAAIAALIPAVISILAPEPAAAASCLPSGAGLCTSNSDCCGDLVCKAGICGPAD